jgi:hypothetical protein
MNFAQNIQIAASIISAIYNKYQPERAITVCLPDLRHEVQIFRPIPYQVQHTETVPTSTYSREPSSAC